MESTTVRFVKIVCGFFGSISFSCICTGYDSAAEDEAMRGCWIEGQDIIDNVMAC